jgi:hypothetical protein
MIGHQHNFTMNTVKKYSGFKEAKKAGGTLIHI